MAHVLLGVELFIKTSLWANQSSQDNSNNEENKLIQDHTCTSEAEKTLQKLNDDMFAKLSVMFYTRNALSKHGGP